MASCCCCSVDGPGLLGQLILATVATHAARNSFAALGNCESTLTVVCRVDAQDTSMMKLEQSTNHFESLEFIISS